jgi:crotonobetainyl-CoA:carnitine CoA-transferase CaiB-like acyl-CoA transferase
MSPRPATKNFQIFCQLIDRESMASDPRFASTALRRQNKQAMNEMIASALRARTTREWFELIVAAGLPCGPVYNVKEAFADPQVQALRIQRSVAHPRLGELDLVAQPCEITGFDREIRTAAPDLGEHNNDILASQRCSGPIHGVHFGAFRLHVGRGFDFALAPPMPSLRLGCRPTGGRR